MKDYYGILGVPDDVAHDDIKSAFRKLAFKYHPDTNPGDKRQAEEQFKEINEAYGVLGDRDKRRQYDLARRAPFAAGAGFRYSQQDIFRDAFANKASYQDLNQMFRQAGLRFDADFLNRVFFGGATYRGAASQGNQGGHQRPGRTGAVTAPGPGIAGGLVIKLLAKLGAFVMRRLLGILLPPPPARDLDQQIDLEISAAEAAAGDEKTIIYRRAGEMKRLMVRIPAGAKSGTRIRLRGMGNRGVKGTGDLYLRVQVRE